MRPIFIGGCPRSGTTLLGAMLGAHSDCVTAPESPFIVHPLAVEFERHGQRITEDMIERLLENWRLKIWGLGLHKPDLMELAGKASIAALTEVLVAAYAKAHDSYPFELWIDHTTSSICHTATLRRHFPEAKFIHLVRDGRSVAASLMRVMWGPNTPKSAALAWLGYLSFGLAAEQTLSEERILRVKFEDLFTKPRQALEAICRFAQLDFQPRMLEGKGFHVPKYTRSQHRLVGTPPNAERVRAWKNELTRREVEIIEYYTAEVLSYLGYELEFGLLAAPPTSLEKGVMEVREHVLRVVNKCRYIIRKRRFAA